VVKLYIESFKNNIKSQLEYKASFIMNSISQLFVFFTYYFIIIALFSKFDNIRGYSVYEVLLCFSIIHFGFAVNETFFRGIDKFEDLIIDGSLDRLLLRPQGVLFQVLCTKIDFIKVFRIIQSLIVMVIALINLDIIWNIGKVIVLLLMLISSVLIFFGLFVLTASYCFITVQGLEVKNLFTDGGKNLAQYPISIYRKGVVFFFTFIIPYGFINYYPLLYFIDKSDNIFYMF
jgi:ABC-2 type transport system permease protein